MGGLLSNSDYDTLPGTGLAQVLGCKCFKQLEQFEIGWVGDMGDLR